MEEEKGERWWGEWGGVNGVEVCVEEVRTCILECTSSSMHRKTRGVALKIPVCMRARVCVSSSYTRHLLSCY